VAATVLAFAEIRTVQVTGPLLGVAGLAIAFASFRKDRPWGLYFGLTMPTAYVFCFSLVCGSRWGPDEARLPLAYILVDVVLLNVASGCAAIGELAVNSGDDRRRVPFQFSIMAMLGLMVLVSVFFGLYDALGNTGMAIGVQFVYAVVVGYFLWQFHVRRSAKKNVCDADVSPSTQNGTADGE
jgi:hypothetical protein